MMCHNQQWRCHSDDRAVWAGFLSWPQLKQTQRKAQRPTPALTNSFTSQTAFKRTPPPHTYIHTHTHTHHLHPLLHDTHIHTPKPPALSHTSRRYGVHVTHVSDASGLSGARCII